MGGWLASAGALVCLETRGVKVDSFLRLFFFLTVHFFLSIAISGMTESYEPEQNGVREGGTRIKESGWHTIRAIAPSTEASARGRKRKRRCAIPGVVTHPDGDV